jgi:hypothetical protein
MRPFNDISNSCSTILFTVTFTPILREMNHITDHLVKQGVHREADLDAWF